MSQDSDRGTPRPGISNPLSDDTIKIMLATDNHIGYNERDPIRGQDSINTFREILQLAVKHDVDFILLAGDLFHENKPSRECLYQTMALLREYTLGDKPIQVELLSDPDEGKAAGFSFPAVNYEDPNLNISIPVFSIHGNHDDPQGAGASGALCALDVLSVSGLINYMGKIDLPLSDAEAATTGIAIRPVLLRKGNTKLGLYGVGNVKDQRMHFELRSNRVRMFMPRDKNSWFNILLVHQNRVKHGIHESVPEGMFDDNINLVVWGHEHDCRIIPESVAGKRYHITQPGSSVATSLADGEAMEKHVALLEVQGKEFQLTPIPLCTVRPFVLESIVLSDVADKDGLDITDQHKISKYLKAKVNALIDDATRQWEERNERATQEGDEVLPEMLPLVRLKVETSGVTEMFNPVRFGQDFQGRVANPRDVLVLHRSKRLANAVAAAAGVDGGRSGKVQIDQPDSNLIDEVDDEGLPISERLAKVRVGTLVKEYLQAQELQLLGEAGMSDAIQMFVEKDDGHAIETHVTTALKSLMNGVRTESRDDINDEEVEHLLAKAREQHEKEYLEKQRSGKSSKEKGKGKAPTAQDAESDDSMMMDIDAGPGIGGGRSDFEEMDSDVQPVATTSRKRGGAGAATTGRGGKKTAASTQSSTATRGTRGKRGAAAGTSTRGKATTARGRGKKKMMSDEDEDLEVIELPDDDEDEFQVADDDEEEPAPKVVKKTNRAAVLSQPATRKTPVPTGAASRKKTPATTNRQAQLTFAPSGTQAPRTARAAATRARAQIVLDDSD